MSTDEQWHPRPRRAPSMFDHFTSSLSIQGHHGQPDVTDLPCDLIEQNGEPYMERHFLLGTNNQAPGVTARYHHILASDQAALHDHPWDYVSVILDGSYVETTPDGEQEYGSGSVLARKAEQLHRLTLPSGPVWTFIIASPPRRRWGFQTDDGWVHWSDYLEAGQRPRRAPSRPQDHDERVRYGGEYPQ